MTVALNLDIKCHMVFEEQLIKTAKFFHTRSPKIQNDLIMNKETKMLHNFSTPGVGFQLIFLNKYAIFLLYSMVCRSLSPRN